MWVKKRHRLTFMILRPFIRIFTFFKYNYRAEKYKGKEPVLILSNHTAKADFFLTMLGFRKQIYFLATDDVFNLGLASKALKFLVNPIPKTKSIKDVEAIRTMLKVSKEKGNICIFPEGNRTFSGGLCPIDNSIGKLAKKLDYDIVIYTIEGGYQSEPRYAKKSSRGKMFGKIKRVITKEEKMNMTADELSEIIITSLTVELIEGISFKSKNKAEYLERCIYHCDECGSLNTMKSHKNDFYCTKCSNKYTFDKFAFLHKDNQRFSVNDLYLKQQQKVRSFTQQDISSLSFEDYGLLFDTRKNMGKKQLIDKTTLKLVNNTLILGDTSINIDEIVNVSLLGGRKINFFTNDKTYQFKGDERFCGMKYMNAIYQNKNIKESDVNVRSIFIGL